MADIIIGQQLLTMLDVTVEAGLCIYCADRGKTLRFRHPAHSAAFNWPDAVTVRPRLNRYKKTPRPASRRGKKLLIWGKGHEKAGYGECF